jgi:hypothetical protein
MTEPLKALTLIQPYGWAIANGYKPVENRTKPPWKSVQGKRIAIHSGMKPLDRNGLNLIGAIFENGKLTANDAGDVERVLRMQEAHQHLLRTEFARGSEPGFVYGAVEATAYLVGGVRFVPDGHDYTRGMTAEQIDQVYESPWRNYAPGTWCYLLTDVTKLPTPVPCKGALGFWNLPEDVNRAVQAQIEAM